MDAQQIHRDAMLVTDQYEPSLQGMIYQMALEVGIAKGRRPGWKYACNAELIFDLGDPPRTTKIFSLDEFSYMQPGNCYSNARDAIYELPELTYVEGMAMSSTLPIPVPHAWLVAESGIIIDPTWANLEAPEATYFGVRFDSTFLDERCEATGWIGILCTDWRVDNPMLKHGLTVNESGMVTAIHPIHPTSTHVQMP